MCRAFTSKKEKGIVSIYVTALMVLFMTASLSMMEMKDASVGDALDITRSGKARLLAQSALQDGKYYTMKIDSGWTGTSQEQSVTAGGSPIGSYDFVTSKSGDVYTIAATGYVPNKSATKKVSYTITSKFSYNSMPVGILVLDPTASGALSMSGNGSIEVVGGRIVVNSSHAKALTGNGNATLEAPQIDIVGNFSMSGDAKVVGDVDINEKAGADPYALVPEPDPSSLTKQAASATSIGSNTTKTLDPGLYVGGISISGNAVVTLNPGTYYLQGGGFSVSGNGVVSASKVMIYNDPSASSHKISLTGNGAVTLTAPDSGTYSGIAFFQKRSSTVEAAIHGNGQSILTGAFYFPGAKMTLSGNGSGDALGTVHVVKTLTLSGNGSMKINTSSPSP